MPRINPILLNMACYLYHSEEDAKAGRNFGGTAFLVSVPSAVPNRNFIFAVTNWHVAVRDGASVLRINMKDGNTDIFDFGPEDWHFDPRYDIAVKNVTFHDERHARAQYVLDGFISQEKVVEARLTPGEDVFMIGRFVDHDGGKANFPTVRFGNISAMPTPLVQPNGKVAPAFLLDMHSRSGYSGSPVFVYRTPGFDLDEKPEGAILLSGVNFLMLLGIHFAQFPEVWEIKDGQVPAGPDGNGVPLITDGKYVSGLSGMTCVLPAWCIKEVLNLPALVQARDEVNRRLLADQAASSDVASNAPPSALRESEV